MTNSKKRILIATGIFPPQVGGPATYAKHLSEEFEKMGHDVQVTTYGWERGLPTGVRHLAFMLKSISKVIWSEEILVLDTYSVGVPIAFATLIFPRPYIVRLGGDFLWEHYLERTHEPLPLPHFYTPGFYSKLSLKEKMIYKLTKFFLSRAYRAVFTTPWFKEILMPAYHIESGKCSVVANTLEPHTHAEPKGKLFLWAGREIFLKNTMTLDEAFKQASEAVPGIQLEMINATHEVYKKHLAECYALLVPSFSEISPNTILDAVSYGKPFIITQYNGLDPEIERLGLTIDPLSVEDIREKIIMLSDDATYVEKKSEIEAFNTFRPWKVVAEEFIAQFK